MKAQVYNAILEIEGHANGKDADRYLRTLSDIRQSAINSHTVVDVITKDDTLSNDCRVKHFRYNYSCGDNCKHEPAPYGILRYFGVYVVLDGEGDKMPEAGDIYKPNPYSELTLCGFTILQPLDRRMELRKVN